MNRDFIFRGGKYSGKTLGWVSDNYPSYLAWIKINQPNMLKGSENKPKPIVTVSNIDYSKENKSSMVPNMNFWDEGPDERSVPYLKKIEEEKEKNLDIPN